MNKVVNDIIKNEALDWARFRITKAGPNKTLHRNAVQAFVESAFFQRTGAYKVLVIESNDMQTLAQSLGGVYDVKNGKGFIKI